MPQVGDRVLCYQFTGDLYRDYVVVPASNCFVLPSGVSYEHGTALVVSYLVAYFCVLDIGHLREGQSILISSCAGIAINAKLQSYSNISAMIKWYDFWKM
jgi:NADPH2:quinone reductase